MQRLLRASVWPTLSGVLYFLSWIGFGLPLPGALGLVLARCNPAAGTGDRNLDGICHAPGRLYLADSPVAGVRVPASSARLPWICAALRRPGIALRGLRLDPPLELAANALAAGCPPPVGPLRHRVRLPASLSELHRRLDDAAAAGDSDRRLRGTVAIDGSPSRRQRSSRRCSFASHFCALAEPEGIAVGGWPVDRRGGGLRLLAFEGRRGSRAVCHPPPGGLEPTQ